MSRLAAVLVLLTCATAALAQERRPAPATAGTVTLPLAEYDRLVDAAAHPARKPEAAPVAAVLARAELKAVVTGASVRGTWTLDGEVFRTGPVRVPLLGGGTLVDARAGGKPVTLLHESGTHSACCRGPRRSRWPSTSPRSWRRGRDARRSWCAFRPRGARAPP